MSELKARSHSLDDLDEEQYQVLAAFRRSLREFQAFGDVAIGDDGAPSLHIHGVVGLKDGTTRGGHVLKATVRPTLEVTMIEVPAHLRRRKRPDLGIALIDPS